MHDDLTPEDMPNEISRQTLAALCERLRSPRVRTRLADDVARRFRLDLDQLNSKGLSGCVTFHASAILQEIQCVCEAMIDQIPE